MSKYLHSSYRLTVLMAFILFGGVLYAQTASFTATPLQPTALDHTVIFTNTSTNATSYKWIITPEEYEDPQFGMLPSYHYISGAPTEIHPSNPEILFERGGFYTVCLIAFNATGSDTFCRYDYFDVKSTVTIGDYVVDHGRHGDLYDVSGNTPTAPYWAGVYRTLLLDPCASQITLNLSRFDLGAGAFLRVYDGRDSTGTPLWNTTASPNGMTGLLNNASVVNPMIATSGFMYIIFSTSPSATLKNGFAASWTSVPLTNVPPPTASFSVPDTVCLSNPALFVNTTTGHNFYQRWYINNVEVGRNLDLTYTFTASGTYDLKLIAFNCMGSDTFSQQINVFTPVHPPTPTFTADIIAPALNETVSFFDLTTYCVSSWEWIITPSTYTFVNGTNQNSRNPQVRFTSEGCYTVKLITGNTFGTDELEKICYIEAVDYCTPVVLHTNDDVGISRVQLNTIDNTSPVGAAAYTDYTLTHSTNLLAGATYQVTLSRNTASIAMNRAVWIDFNQNGFFEPSERVAFEGSTNNLTWTASFTVPVNAIPGATRMRVGARLGSQLVTPCGGASTHLYGEFEDYRINIIPDVTPPVITLTKPDTVYIERGHPYIEPGYIAQDNADGNITSRVAVTGSVDTLTEGTYILYYNVSDMAGNPAQQRSRVVIVTPDVTPPVITLINTNPFTILVLEPFYEPGATAYDRVDGNLTDSIKITGTVNTNTLGSYIRTYTVSDAAGNISTRTRTFIVADTVAPVIEFLGGDTIFHEVYTPWPANFSHIQNRHRVTDNYYSNIRATMVHNVNVNVPGPYSIIYCATDLSNNTSCTTRVVIVRDSTPPVVNLIGPNPYTVLRWRTYNDPGATVTDNYDNNLPAVMVNNTVDMLLPGEYMVQYIATDNSGNVSDTVTRTVIVTENVSSNFESLSNKLNVYPNPGSGIFNIEFDSPQSNEIAVSVYNVLGKEVLRVFEGRLENTLLNFDISSMAAGIYYVKVSTGNELSVKKIMKH